MSTGSLLDQTTRGFEDVNGNTMPLLRTQFGLTHSAAVTTTPGAAVQVHTSNFARAVRIWAIGCPIIYKMGGSDVAAPAAADGYIGADRSIETWMAPDENYIRYAAGSGTGSIKIEVLR